MDLFFKNELLEFYLSIIFYLDFVIGYIDNLKSCNKIVVIDKIKSKKGMELA